MTRHLHLDAIGGMAGDMFLAAMLSAFPDAHEKLETDLDAAGLSGRVRMEPERIREKGFAAIRMNVSITETGAELTTWAQIREKISASNITENVKKRAISIFRGLAEAEASSHAIPIEQVHFHELSDWDSIADVIGAASVIEYAKVFSWSVSALPLGGGRTNTQHGLIPVPAPATAELLKGYSFLDDGGPGERITPTGAAILKHLAPSQLSTGPRGKLVSSGMGAGNMQIDGIPNILRILCFENSPNTAETINIIRFEIDDMTPEELALSLDRLRSSDAVLEASHTTGIGKKGRPQFSVSVMIRPEWCNQIVEDCFQETTTLGLRVETVERHVLPREAAYTDGIRTKRAERPMGTTVKAESDDLVSISTLKERRAKASRAESACD